MQNGAYTKPLNLELSIEDQSNALKLQKISKNKFEGDYEELALKICLLKQSWTKYLEQNTLIQKY